MKNLSKALALALLLAPAAAQAIPWCKADNQHIWTFSSGQTPYTFDCDDVGTPTITYAEAYAETHCQQGWDNFASDYAFDGPRHQLYYTQIPGNPGMCRWKYRCRGCVLGHLPYIIADHPARLRPADAAMAATDVVKGVVMKIEISDDGDDEADQEGPHYLVDVLTETRMVQVVVDATTGRAQIVTDDDEVSCLR